MNWLQLDTVFVKCSDKPQRSKERLRSRGNEHTHGHQDCLLHSHQVTSTPLLKISVMWSFPLQGLMKSWDFHYVHSPFAESQCTHTYIIFSTYSDSARVCCSYFQFPTGSCGWRPESTLELERGEDGLRFAFTCRACAHTYACTVCKYVIQRTENVGKYM